MHSIISPQPNFQTNFVKSNVDVVVGGAAMGSGKTMAALLIAAQNATDPNFKMMCLRKNLTDTKIGGGMVDEASELYKDVATAKISDTPRVTFKWGSFIDFSHMNDESKDKLLERVRGWQYDCVYFDEGTGFEWSTFKTIFSRNRGTGKWTGKIRITCNPKRSHWLRKWVDWNIDPIKGTPIPERDGVVRYFFINGERVEDVVFGLTKEEVYHKCFYQIDPIINNLNKKNIGRKVTYEDMIKSTVFFSGEITDNQIMLKNNPGYVGSVAAMGEKNRKANLENNWNVDADYDETAPIERKAIMDMFDVNDDKINGDKWITCDLADTGTDNFIAMMWNGFHLYDIDIMCKSTPKQNAERLMYLAAKHDISDSHIVYDAIRGSYINDYIPDAIQFVSYRNPIGMYGRMAYCLKDECYLRLVKMVNSGGISISDNVWKKLYIHQNIKAEINIATEIEQELGVVRFQTVASGKKRLFTKKEMNAMLGKGRSMDLADPIAMRMFPCAEYEYGTEMTATTRTMDDEYDDDESEHNVDSIYSETFWN